MTPSPAPLDRLVPADLAGRLIGLRHELHRHPELAFKETATAARLEAWLRPLEPVALERVAGTGVVARLRGRRPDAPVVAIRGDIDALPIQEETGASFASTVPGVMHACGHDVHAAWTAGAAALLAAEPAEGDVLIVLQPAEETGRGAPALLEAGALADAAAILGGHVDLRYELGKVIADEGPLAASTDTFSIDIRGRGAHGARPHEGRDPIVAAAALIAALQTVVSRRVGPGDPAVVTVGTIAAGTAANVIPDRARLTGTLRAVRPATRQRLIDAVRELAAGVGAAHGTEIVVLVEAGTPPIVNPAEAIGWARTAVRALLGADALVPLPEPNLAGEDFAFYLERLPGCFLRIGARRGGTPIVPAHTSRFLPDDAAVLVGAAVLAAAAREASRALAEA